MFKVNKKALEPPKPEHNPEGSNHYRSTGAMYGILAPLAILAVWGGIAGVLFFEYYKLLQNWSHGYYEYGTAVFICLVLNAIYLYLADARRNTVNVRLEKNHMVCKNIYLFKKVIAYKDVEAVVFVNSFWAKEICIFLKGPSEEWTRLKSSIFAYGEMMERILPELSNVKEVYLRKRPNRWSHWKKKPDWGILSAAMGRAAENDSGG